MRRGRGFLWLCGVMALALMGCAGYRLGPTGGHVAGAHSIQIKPFDNKTLEPLLNDYLMVSLRKNLIQNGTYRVDTQGDGDIVLTGVITAYQRTGISVQPTDVLTVLDYQVTMTVKMTARERVTGKIIYDGVVAGYTTIQAGADLTSAERQAIPQLTDDLARRATAVLADGTW